MQYLPHFPIHINVISLFGLILLLGLIAGELTRLSYFLPRISGYIAVGFILGPSVLNLATPSLLSEARIFVDISLALILFALGRHLDLIWLRHDHGILKMAITESFLTFICIFALLLIFHIPWVNAALVATIAIATSPAVVMMVANDLSSKGPVTRRTLILTSLNNLFALILFTIFVPMSLPIVTNEIFERIAYTLFGSITIGVLIFALTLFIAYFIGKRKENQFVLIVGSLMFAIGLSSVLELSTMLTLFTLGVAARNLNYKHFLVEIDFGWLAKLFFILLFVTTGVHLQLQGLWLATGIVIAFILIRFIAKSMGIWLFAKSSKLTAQQAWALCLTLTPMAGLAVGMSNIILDINPALGYQLVTIITTAVAVLNIVSPIAVQLAFIKSGEVISENMRIH